MSVKGKETPSGAKANEAAENAAAPELSKPELPVKQAEADAPATIESGWGAAEGNDQKDLLVSKIYQQQAISKMVDAGKAQVGDWCDSVAEEVICKKDSPLEIIVFHSYKNLLVSKFDHVSNRFKWVRTETLGAHNADREFEEETQEGRMRNQIQYNFFCLLPSRIDDLPMVLSMSSTKTKTAKKLNTFFQKLRQRNKPSAAYVFLLKSEKVQNDQGTWMGIDVLQGRATTKEELQAAYDWYNVVKTKRVNVASDADEANESSRGDVKFDDDDVPF